MSKHKKKLIIEDDDCQEHGDELNPFSFKEFIRSKNQHFSTREELDDNSHSSQKKTYGGMHLGEGYYLPPRGFDNDHQGNFFTEPSALTQSFEEEPEEEWTGSYQPAAIEEAHTFDLGRTLDCSTYSGQSSSIEDKHDSVCSWHLDGEYSPEAHPARRSTGSYEGDEETSIVDLAYSSTKSNSENGSKNFQKIRDENVLLRKQLKELLKKSESDDMRIRNLNEELHKRKVQEEREAKALETMVHSVEQNLHLMTKRAVKAENTVTKLKQDLHQLQGQLEGYRSENDRLRAGEMAAISTMKRNAHVASEYLNKAAHDAETSIKQLLTGAETLTLVSQLLSSMDKISETH
ncbi:endosome-associated-trafficking regulator 1 [Denticeps clupeoides]|uniref:Endosome-associated-trafficking regulator 1 n=1 Tax=Denticeps clupeoides TaxID=299321 RepID=A0AAY3ZVP2_9TELE|nr:endosome-associated-trafficking regulator 1-like [Denticeps clupeoides]